MEDQSSRACANTDDPNGRSRPIRFSNRPFRVKRFQIHPTVSMSLAGRASLRIGTKAVPEASWHVDGGAIGQRDHGATPGTVIKRRHTSSSRTMASKRRCRMPSCSRYIPQTTSGGSTSTAKSGRSSTSSLMRAANLAVPTMPT